MKYNSFSYMYIYNLDSNGLGQSSLIESFLFQFTMIVIVFGVMFHLETPYITHIRIDI